MVTIPRDKINCLDRVKEDDQGLSSGEESTEEREMVSELGEKLDKKQLFYLLFTQRIFGAILISTIYNAETKFGPMTKK